LRSSRPDQYQTWTGFLVSIDMLVRRPDSPSGRRSRGGRHIHVGTNPTRVAPVLAALHNKGSRLIALIGRGSLRAPSPQPPRSRAAQAQLRFREAS
jgi:hypothetical protein